MLSDLLCDRVQHNCNIADAKYAANYTLCIYLMKMREYYRWEHGYSYDAVLPQAQVGEWVTAREDLWEELEDTEFSAILIDGKSFDPFDTHEINAALKDKGMVYSGGLGLRSAPHFFLGKLEALHAHEGYEIIVSAEECARDLGAPPAMTLGNTIFIRKESIRRMLWERIQEWQWHKHAGAMANATSFYPFDENIEQALDKMTEAELQAIILHEIGEIKATTILGAPWKDMLAAMAAPHVEIVLRAAKDLLADALSTLPDLIEQQRSASIHFYAANMTAMRKKICPSFMRIYHEWCDDGDMLKLKAWVQKSQCHWQNVLTEVLQLFSQQQSVDVIENFITENHL